MKYNKKLDKTASTIDADKFINDEFKTYVENSNIERMIDIQIQQTGLSAELDFRRRINSITKEGIKQIIDKEMKIVNRLIHEKVTWQMGMCMLDDKEKLIDMNM